MSATSEGVKAATPPESRPVEAAPAPQIDAQALRRRFAGLLSVAGGLLLWELISRLLIDNALFLAAPSQIALAIYNLTITGQLGHHVAVSAIEFVVGYVIGSALG